MPTSARRSPDCRRGAEAGLTLVEMLVVLAIIAVASGAAMLSFGGDGGPRAADAEARKLAIALQRASDDALVASRPASMAWTAEGYAVAGAAHLVPAEHGDFAFRRRDEAQQHADGGGLAGAVGAEKAADAAALDAEGEVAHGVLAAVALGHVVELEGDGGHQGPAYTAGGESVSTGARPHP